MLLAAAVLPGAAWADTVPEALQGRWGAPAGQCATPGEGLTLSADGLTFVSGATTVVAGVEASDVGEFRARLTIVSVVRAGAEDIGPEVGDSLVLERTGDTLQGVETMRGGVARDISGDAPMVACP